MTVAVLANRGVIRVSGPDTRNFLQGLVTCDIEKITPTQAGFGALLSPQGKILFDFFIYATEGGFLFDCPRDLAADLAKRLGFYKLRAKVVIENLSDQFHVEALWNAASPDGWSDPRDARLGLRIVRPGAPAQDPNFAAYESLRISLGVADGGVDYLYGDTFPHEANLDRFGGVDFHKGCYVGQEVVSRMQHKTVVRKRLVAVVFSGEPLPLGGDVMAGELVAGRMGSSIPGHGLALLRLDRADDARNSGTALTVENRTIEIQP